MLTNNKPELVIALDIPSRVDAFILAEQLSNYPIILKVHWVLYPLIGHDGLKKLADLYDGRIFIDFKMHDIPSVVAHGVTNLMQSVPFRILTVHASGGMKMMSAAVEARDEVFNKGCECPVKPQILGVTMVTSLNDSDLYKMGSRFDNILDASMSLASLAHDSGLDGVVSSVHECSKMKSSFGREFKVLTPGIRPEGSDKHEQMRVATPSMAKQAGSDYIVVGRPITKSKTPELVVEQILHELDE